MPKLAVLLSSTALLAVAAVAPVRAEIKADVIRIGVLSDMSGVFATAMGPGSITAARMAAKEFGGAIDGKPIVILQADHQNKPDIAFTQVKTPAESTGPWDLVKLVTTVPADEAFRPLADSHCPLVNATH